MLAEYEFDLSFSSPMHSYELPSSYHLTCLLVLQNHSHLEANVATSSILVVVYSISQVGMKDASKIAMSITLQNMIYLVTEEPMVGVASFYF